MPRLEDSCYTQIFHLGFFFLGNRRSGEIGSKSAEPAIFTSSRPVLAAKFVDRPFFRQTADYSFTRGSGEESRVPLGCPQIQW
jgi:hypothetical protein